MFDLIQDILSKPEIKKELETFYHGYRFLVLQIGYFSVLCIYIFAKCYYLLGLNANPYTTTFFSLLVAMIIFKSVLVYKKEIYTVYPSFLLYMFCPDSNQLLGFMAFFLNPIFYMILIRTLQSSTCFIVDEYRDAHLSVLLLFMLPFILEIFIFMFLIIIFMTADVISSKTIITKHMEKQFEKDSVDCLICKCEFEENELLTTLKCAHKFHDDCIITWFKFNNACPLCKQTLLQQGSLREIVSKTYN